MSSNDATSWQAEIAALRAEARHMHRAFSVLQQRYFHCAAQLADVMPRAEPAASTPSVSEHAVETLPPLLEYYPDPMLVVDAGGRIVTVNGRFLRMTGMSVDTVIGRTATEFLSPDVSACLAQAQDARALAGELVEDEYWFDAPDGSHFLQCRYCPVEIDGRVAYVVVTLRDLTDWKQADEEREYLLQQIERHAAELDAVFTAMTDSVLVYNCAGEITLMNDAAEQMLDYTPELRAMSVAQRLAALRVITPDGHPLPPEQAPTLRALHGEAVRGFVQAHQYPDRTLWLSVGATPIRTGDGDLHGAVVTLTDITAQHAAQEQQRTFLHMVTHDLRVPLTVILGHRELLQRALAPNCQEKALHSLDTIDRAAHRMNVMIEDLVEAARLEGGQLHLAPQPVALDAFLTELLERAAASLERDRITVDVSPALPPVLADVDRLERILLNLLTNAQKYSEPGAFIIIRAEHTDTRIVIAVIDRGPGIPPHALPHLFERFYRAPDGRKADGIGLGLYISRLLVEAHGGAIRAESTPGEGSVFTVTLPAAE